MICFKSLCLDNEGHDNFETSLLTAKITKTLVKISWLDIKFSKRVLSLVSLAMLIFLTV